MDDKRLLWALLLGGGGLAVFLIWRDRRAVKVIHAVGRQAKAAGKAIVDPIDPRLIEIVAEVAPTMSRVRAFAISQGHRVYIEKDPSGADQCFFTVTGKRASLSECQHLVAARELEGW
jgi:hypothetical protein